MTIHSPSLMDSFNPNFDPSDLILEPPRSSSQNTSQLEEDESWVVVPSTPPKAIQDIQTGQLSGAYTQYLVSKKWLQTDKIVHQNIALLLSNLSHCTQGSCQCAACKEMFQKGFSFCMYLNEEGYMQALGGQHVSLLWFDKSKQNDYDALMKCKRLELKILASNWDPQKGDAFLPIDPSMAISNQNVLPPDWKQMYLKRLNDQARQCWERTKEKKIKRGASNYWLQMWYYEITG
ncbi:hypothetical protein [Candidatus Protochlamydia phocaeensis]|uniref:hypothetical protein n=1 Tax=Candidatus Protochlamydia phocaeensis TaxID=1414722 RepID=UPI000838AF50|nr:hypothetical protein [Candidatus Protochlamydia phocaeensis]